MRICVLAVVLAGACGAQPQPLRRIPVERLAGDISILSVDFQELLYGHEGPGYFSVERAPLRGQHEIAEVSLFGQEAIRTVRFELIGRTGAVLTVAPAFRIGDAADDSQYMLRVDVPAEPFRFRITGQDVDGRPYATVFPSLFVPADGTIRPIQYPAGLSEEQKRLLEGLTATAAAKMQSRFDAAIAQGAIRIARSTIGDATYEPLVSAAGNPIGMRVRFVARFEQAGFYSLTPQVYTAYRDVQWRGAVGMKVLDAEAVPPPAEAAGSLPYGGPARYEAGVDYNLRFDMVPDYIIRNAAQTRYCMYLEPFRTTARMPVWQSIQASTELVKYRVSIGAVEFSAETPPWTPQRTFYDSFLSEGARDCGPTPNIQF